MLHLIVNLFILSLPHHLSIDLNYSLSTKQFMPEALDQALIWSPLTLYCLVSPHPAQLILQGLQLLSIARLNQVRQQRDCWRPTSASDQV